LDEDVHRIKNRYKFFSARHQRSWHSGYPGVGEH